jgi:hypothetical protein
MRQEQVGYCIYKVVIILPKLYRMLKKIVKDGWEREVGGSSAVVISGKERELCCSHI